jgi:hypothetical protein
LTQLYFYKAKPCCHQLSANASNNSQSLRFSLEF